ncbi:hypothetical protein DIPPA_15978 [Diplonema papillatum]|nr:hypothetical protein DIPPA_15978 [Diplonema papillatum]
MEATRGPSVLLPLLLLLLRAAGAAAWWRPSGWVPGDAQTLRVENAAVCTGAFIRAAGALSPWYRTRCPTEIEVGMFYTPQNSAASLAGDMTEAACVEACFYESKGLPFVTNTRTMAAYSPRTHLLDEAVQVAHRPKNGSSGYCYCGDTRSGPVGPPRTAACETYGLEVPPTCLFLSRSACRGSASDACRWTGGCCLDAIDGVSDGSEEDPAAVNVSIIVGLVVTISASVLACCCYASIRRREQAGTTTASVGPRSLPDVQDAPRAPGSIDDGFLASIALALAVIAETVDPETAGLVSSPKEASVIFDNHEPFATPKWSRRASLPSLDGKYFPTHAETNPPVTLKEATAPSEAGQQCVVCLESGCNPSGVCCSDIPFHRVINRLVVALTNKPPAFELPRSGWGFLPCSHVMHFHCIEMWFVEQGRKQKPPSCPVCRTAVPLEADVVKSVVVRVETASPRVLRLPVFSDDTTESFLDRIRDTSGRCLSPEAELHFPGFAPPLSKIYPLVENNALVRVTEPRGITVDEQQNP